MHAYSLVMLALLFAVSQSWSVLWILEIPKGGSSEQEVQNSEF